MLNRRYRTRRVRTTEVVYDDRGTFLRHRQRVLAADAAAGARYDHHFSVKQPHEILQSDQYSRRTTLADAHRGTKAGQGDRERSEPAFTVDEFHIQLGLAHPHRRSPEPAVFLQEQIDPERPHQRSDGDPLGSRISRALETK